MEIPSAETDAWNVAEGTDQGTPSLIRYRPNLQEYMGDNRYPRRLVIIWEFEKDNSSGMPSNEQSDNMRALEDAVVGVFDHDKYAVLAFVFTKSGIREWHFYLNDVDEAGARINNALSELPKFPISIQVEDDENWDALREVFEIVN